MRDVVYDYIEANLPSGFYIKNTLPYDKNAGALFLKNPKTVFVDAEEYADPELIVQTLDGGKIVEETILVSVYIATDAKRKPTNYSELVDIIKFGTYESSFANSRYQTHEVTEVTSDYDADLEVTQFDISFLRTIFK